MTVIRRKLIEVSLPLEAINRESAREKFIRHGHPSTLHLWWARRPLAACRAVLLAQLIDDPSSHPDRFPTEDDQRRERARLFKVIESVTPWEESSAGPALTGALVELGVQVPEDLTLVDPFAGGGSIPLEAKRLGFRALASDLNPLPVVLNSVLLEMTDRFQMDGESVDPMLTRTREVLAADVETWARELEKRVFDRVSHHYPTGETGAVSLVYFWARTVECPNPACACVIPLVGSWQASNRKGSLSTFVPKITVDGRAVEVDVKHGSVPPPPATLERTGGRCLRCGNTFELQYVKDEGMAGRMGVQLLAVQERKGRARSFRPATEADRLSAHTSPGSAEWLESDLSTHSQYMAPPRYGLTRFRDLFLDRQLSTLIAFVDELDGLTDEIAEDSRARVLSEDERGYFDGGSGRRAYAEALRILLALGIGRLINRASSLCIWDAGANKVNQVFSRQAYSMTWLFAEANPFGGGSGSFAGQIEFLAKAVRNIPSGRGIAIHAAAQTLVFPKGCVVSTDPPYYDSVPYADLSDFFLVWLRQMLFPLAPSLFGTVLAPKGDELVADSTRHGGKLSAATFFDLGLRRVFENIWESHSDEYPMTVYYAFKANDMGWETFLQSLISAGWEISGTWPIRTEQAGGLRQLGRNALASSVVVVCRKRSGSAEETSRRGFLTVLKEEMPKRLRVLQEGGIAPVDLAQASIGPGMAVFSRFDRVTEVDGSDMSVRTALAVINQALDEILTDQEGDFDSDTRFALKWFSQFGWNEGQSGEADVLARAVNTSLNHLERGGIFSAVAGRARLLEPKEMTSAWNPADDKAISVWEVALRVAHSLRGVGMERAAAELSVAGTRVDVDAVKELTYLLFAASDRKGWTDSALLFNSLGTSWGDLVAESRVSRSPDASQGELDLDSDE